MKLAERTSVRGDRDARVESVDFPGSARGQLSNVETSPTLSNSQMEWCWTANMIYTNVGRFAWPREPYVMPLQAGDIDGIRFSWQVAVDIFSPRPSRDKSGEARVVGSSKVRVSGSVRNISFRSRITSSFRHVSTYRCRSDESRRAATLAGTIARAGKDRCRVEWR